MHDPKCCVCREQCLREVLLGLMQSQGALPWPGADGVTIDDVLGEYALAVQRGLVPGAEELARRFPHLANEVTVALGEEGVVEAMHHCRGQSGSG